MTMHMLWASVQTLLADVPDPGDGKEPPGAEKFLLVLQWGKWLFGAAAVGGGLAIAALMVIAHRRGDDTQLARLGWWLAGCVLAGSVTTLANFLF